MSNQLVIVLNGLKLRQEKIFYDPAEIWYESLLLDYILELLQFRQSFLRVLIGMHLSLVLPVKLHDPVVHRLDQTQNLLSLLYATQIVVRENVWNADYMTDSLLDSTIHSLVGLLDLVEDLEIHWLAQRRIAQHRSLSD